MLGRRRKRTYALAAAALFFIGIFLLSPRLPLAAVSKNTIQGIYRPKDVDETRFNKGQWFFEAELPEEWYPRPDYDIKRLSKIVAHNYRGVGFPTFATYFSSRNGTLQDPYFLAVQQLVYRVLWDPRSRSQHPFTVFVAPFIPQEQRDILAAAGAHVKELPLVEVDLPLTGKLIAGRLRDMFSKLAMWKETSYSRIAYLDGDAFPLVNVDGIFDQAPMQKCKRDLLPLYDRSSKTICDYVMSATREPLGSMNAGVLVLKPDKSMYLRLMRESTNTSNFDSGMMEQAFLSYAFSQEGPFPYAELDQPWNAFPDSPERGIEPKILHGKLWAMFWENTWCSQFFNETWTDMLSLYNSSAFTKARLEDGSNFINNFNTKPEKQKSGTGWNWRISDLWT